MFGLDLNEAFRDFNFSVQCDPTMRSGPTEAELLELVYRGRRGDMGALADFADAMFYTLRIEAFEAYQRAHGPVAISHREWFHEKLCSFFGILLYRSVVVEGIVDGDCLSTELPIEPGFKYATYFCLPDMFGSDEIEKPLAPKTTISNCGMTWPGPSQERPTIALRRPRTGSRAIGRHREPPPVTGAAGRKIKRGIRLSPIAWLAEWTERIFVESWTSAPSLRFLL